MKILLLFILTLCSLATSQAQLTVYLSKEDNQEFSQGLDSMFGSKWIATKHVLEFQSTRFVCLTSNAWPKLAAFYPNAIVHKPNEMDLGQDEAVKSSQPYVTTNGYIQFDSFIATNVFRLEGGIYVIQMEMEDIQALEKTYAAEVKGDSFVVRRKAPPKNDQPQPKTETSGSTDPDNVNPDTGKPYKTRRM